MAMTEVAPPARISVSETTLAEAKRSLRDISAHSNNKRASSSAAAADGAKKIAPTPVKPSEDVIAVQQLLAALSFSPQSVLGFPSASTTVDENAPPKQFSFESPQKKSTTNDTDHKNSSTPWVRPEQSTPPTAKLEDEEDDEEPEFAEEDEFAVVPSQGEDSSASATTTEEAASSPVRSLRSSTNSADAVAMAYPLCLPAEYMRKSGAATTTSTTKTSNGQSKKSFKPCKRYPPVTTEIPGVGVQRSSAVIATKGKNKFSPFALIAASDKEATDSKGRPLFSRKDNANDNNNNNVAHHVYDHAKGAWAWGKDNVGLVSPLLGLAEGVVSKVADITTGNGDLEHVDHQVVEPFVNALDERVLNPVLGTVGGFFSGILGKKTNNEE